MPVITCPTCGTKLDIDAPQMGTDVQCGSCQQVFQAKDEKGEGRSRKSKYRRDDDEDDDRPRRKSKYRREDDDEEDYDYGPRPDSGRADGRNPGTGMGVTALVLGIVGILMAFCCWPVGVVCALLAVIFGCVSLGSAGRGMGIAGIVLGVLSILLAVGMFFIIGGLGAFNAALAPRPAPFAPAPAPVPPPRLIR